jgi:YVTN family beta-propeller protein
MKSIFAYFTHKKQIKYLFVCITLIAICSLGIYANVFASVIDDSNPPILQSFTSSPSTGSFGTGIVINIYANFDEDLDLSSTMSVTLDTGGTVTLDTTNSNGCSVSSTQLCGAYTVSSGENSSDLTINTIDGGSVTDMDSTPNTNGSYSVPGGNNLGDTSSVVVDTVIPSLSSATINGAVLTLSFSKNIYNASLPEPSDFVVSVNGSPVSVSFIVVSSASLLLNFANPVSFNDTVILNYAPSTYPIKDLSGNLTDSIVNQTVDNDLTKSKATIDVPNVNSPYYSKIIGTKLYYASKNQLTDVVTVVVIDTVTDSVTKLISMPADDIVGIGGIVSVGEYVYIASSNYIYVIDSKTDTYSRISNTAAGSVFYMSVVGTKIYVNSADKNYITVIDINTNTSSTVNMSEPSHSSAVVGRKVYVNNNSFISVIDTTITGDPIVNTISGSGLVSPYFSLSKGNYLYVTSHGSDSVSIIDTRTDTVVDNISTGAGSDPQYMTLVGDKLYVANHTNHTVSVINTITNALTGTVTVGEGPYDILGVGTNVFVFNQAGYSISVIDSITDMVIKTFRTRSTSFSGSVYENQKLYVNNQGGGEGSFVIDINTLLPVNVFAPHLLSLTSPQTGHKTVGDNIVLQANFNKTLASNSKIRVILNTGRTVDLDQVSGSTLSGTYIVQSGDYTPDLSITSISTSSTYTLVSDTESTPNSNSSFYTPLSPDLTGDTSRNLGDLKNISIGTEPLTIPTGTNPYQMVTVGNYTYVANQGSNNVTIFNNTTNTVIGTTTVGSQPYGMAYNSTSKEIYVANLKGNSVSVIDADPANTGTWNTVTHTIDSTHGSYTGVEPYYVTSLGTKMYVTNNLSWTVSEIDTTTHAVTATINVGANPRGIKALGSKLYVANFGSNYGGQTQGTVSIIDTANSHAVTTINVGSGPRGVTTNGTDVYVANFN